MTQTQAMLEAEIERLRAELDEARVDVDRLVASRERMAMLIPLGEESGAVEDDLAAHLERLRRTNELLATEVARLRSVIDNPGDLTWTWFPTYAQTLVLPYAAEGARITLLSAKLRAHLQSKLEAL